MAVIPVRDEVRRMPVASPGLPPVDPEERTVPPSTIGAPTQVGNRPARKGRPGRKKARTVGPELSEPDATGNLS